MVVCANDEAYAKMKEMKIKYFLSIEKRLIDEQHFDNSIYFLQIFLPAIIYAVERIATQR
jgi:hypothetical protein